MRSGFDPLLVSPVVAIAYAHQPQSVRSRPPLNGGRIVFGEVVAVYRDVRLTRATPLTFTLWLEEQAWVKHQFRLEAQIIPDQRGRVFVAHRDRLEVAQSVGPLLGQPVP